MIRFKLEEFEVVLTLQCVLLDTKQTSTGNKLFLAVGTGQFRGEDLTARGRVCLFNLIVDTTL
jgi:cleavage and polyadenylation specificity factor subunit 1